MVHVLTLLKAHTVKNFCYQFLAQYSLFLCSDAHYKSRDFHYVVVTLTTKVVTHEQKCDECSIREFCSNSFCVTNLVLKRALVLYWIVKYWLLIVCFHNEILTNADRIHMAFGDNESHMH